MNTVLIRQLSLDYCCSEQEILDPKNIFTVYRPIDGRRRFPGDNDTFLKAAVFHGKLLMSGSEKVIDRCADTFKDFNAAWFMEPNALFRLNQMIGEFGYSVHSAHPFFLGERLSSVPEGDFELLHLSSSEIEDFRGNTDFSNAFGFYEDLPDVLGVAAYRDGRILGAAGASADSPAMWQVGIDVLPRFRGQGIATALVTALKNEIIQNGRLPFYGTALSHVASMRTALAAGFFPAWAELSCRRTVDNAMR